MAENVGTRLSKTEKFFYGFGDFGNGMTFQFTQLYLLKFYTDIVHIPAYWAGLIFLVMKFADAFIDVAVGMWVDGQKKLSKKGKFRPFILYGAGFLSLSAVACFVAPSFSITGKIIYGFVTYAIMSALYSVVNIPYGSLAASITQNSEDRSSLSLSRNIGAQLASLISGLAVPIIAFFGDGSTNSARGYFMTALCFAVVGCISQWLCYKFVKERHVVADAKNSSVKALLKSIKYLFKNGPFIALTFYTLFSVGAMFLQMGIQLYFFQYVLGNENILSWCSIIMFISLFPVLSVSTKLVKKVGKKNVALIGSFGQGIVDLIIYFYVLNSHSLPVFFVLMFIADFFMGLMNSVVFAFVSDVVEYGEYHTGVRSEGITYSAYSFIRKVTQAVGGFVPGFALSIIGYVANQPQTISVQHGISTVYMLIPGLLAILGGAIFLLGYKLTDKKHDEIVAELRNRYQKEGIVEEGITLETTSNSKKKVVTKTKELSES